MYTLPIEAVCLLYLFRVTYWISNTQVASILSSQNTTSTFTLPVGVMHVEHVEPLLSTTICKLEAFVREDRERGARALVPFWAGKVYEFEKYLYIKEDTTSEPQLTTQARTLLP